MWWCFCRFYGDTLTHKQNCKYLIFYVGLNPVYVSRTDTSMSRCFTANSSHVWLLSCQRLQEMDDDRKVYIITDLATAGPGPTLGDLYPLISFTHTLGASTLITRSMPEACRTSWGKEGQKNRNHVKEEMWQDILKLVDVEEHWKAFALFRIFADYTFLYSCTKFIHYSVLQQRLHYSNNLPGTVHRWEN